MWNFLWNFWSCILGRMVLSVEIERICRRFWYTFFQIMVTSSFIILNSFYVRNAPKALKTALKMFRQLFIKKTYCRLLSVLSTKVNISAKTHLFFVSADEPVPFPILFRLLWVSLIFLHLFLHSSSEKINYLVSQAIHIAIHNFSVFNFNKTSLNLFQIYGNRGTLSFVTVYLQDLL